MTRVVCDRCEHAFEAAEVAAGDKVPCPRCGDINRVPGVTGAGATAGAGVAEENSRRQRADKAAAAGYPPDSGPEVEVVKVRRCWFRSRPVRSLLAWALLVVGVAGMAWVGVKGLNPWWYAAAGPAAAIGAVFLAWWWIDRYSACMVITTKRTVMHNGFFSRSTSEVVHDNIRNLQVDQSFWQRIWRVGRLGISSSGQDGIEIQVNHLPGPDRLRVIIDLYRPL